MCEVGEDKNNPLCISRLRPIPRDLIVELECLVLACVLYKLPNKTFQFNVEGPIACANRPLCKKWQRSQSFCKRCLFLLLVCRHALHWGQLLKQIFGISNAYNGILNAINGILNALIGIFNAIFSGI